MTSDEEDAILFENGWPKYRQKKRRDKSSPKKIYGTNGLTQILEVVFH